MLKVSWFGWLQKQWHLFPQDCPWATWASGMSQVKTGAGWGLDCLTAGSFLPTQQTMKKHYNFIYLGNQGCSDSQTDSLNEWKKMPILNPSCGTRMRLLSPSTVSRKTGEIQRAISPALSLSLLSVCFYSFPKQLDFRTKRIGTMLWVSWLFSVVSPWPCLYSNRAFCTQYMRLNWRQILLQSHILNRHQPSLPLHCSNRISCHVVPLLWRSACALLQHSHLSPVTLCRAGLQIVL